jgi:hypothetical protein
MQENKLIFGRRIKVRLFFALCSIIIVLFVPTYEVFVFEHAGSFIKMTISMISFILFWIISFNVLSRWYLTDDEFEKTLINSLDKETITRS